MGMPTYLVLEMETDKMIPRHVCNKTFMIRFPNRSDWERGLQPHRYVGLIWYTAGSQTNEGTS
jgi:hypothetical protein